MTSRGLALALAVIGLVGCASSRPATGDPSDPIIILQRMGCLGRCPNFAVTVHLDGRVEFEDRSGPDAVRRQTAQIDPGLAAGLFAEAKTAGFFKLRSEYTERGGEGLVSAIFLRADGREKWIVEQGGERVGLPLAIKALEADIERVAGTDRWVTPD